MGLGAIFIFGLVIALFVAFSRIGALERQVRELRDAIEGRRADSPFDSEENAAPEPIKSTEKRLPAHLKPVAPMQTVQVPAPTREEKSDEPEPVLTAQVTFEERSALHSPPPVPPQKRPATPRPAPARPAAPAGPTFEQRAAEFVRKIGPQDPNMSWETALGTYWLPRIAAVFLSVAAVLFLTLALQRFGAGARVGVGYAVTAAFLGAAYGLERNYAAYARVVYGLGLALLYLVTFATYYFPPARIFETPLATLLLLAAIISFFIGIAQYRRSPTIALVSLLLGHFTIGLGSLTLDNPGFYSSAGILVLSMGGAYFLLRDRWYAIAAVGMLGSYFNHFVLMLQSESQGLVSEFAIGIGVLSGYYLIYALAELFSHEEARKAMPNWFRSAFVSVNTACYFGLGTLLVAGFDFTEDYQHVFRYCLAVALFALGILYLRFRGRDRIYNAYLTKGSAALTLGLAAQFSGATLTATLAVQMVVLLISARLSGLVVTRVLAIVLAGLAFLHGAYTVIDAGVISRDDPSYLAALIQYALTVLAFFTASQLYQRTDWSSRSPRGDFLNDDTRDMLWRLDLVSEPARPEAQQKPLDGLLFPTIYAIAGALLFLQFAFSLTEYGERFGAFGIAALALVLLGRAVNSPPFVAAFLLPLFSALVSGTGEAAGANPSYAGFLSGAVPLAVLGFLVEPKIAGKHASLAFLHARPMAYLVHGVAAWVAVVYLSELHESPANLYLISLAGVYYLAISFAVTPVACGYVAAAVLVAGQLLWYPYAYGEPEQFHVATWVLVGLAIAADRLSASRTLAGAGSVLVLSSIAVLIRYAYVTAGDDWTPVAWVALAVGAGGYSALFRSWAAFVGAAAAGILASIQALVTAYPDAPATHLLVLSFMSAAGWWIMGERIASYTGRGNEAIRSICIALATLLLLCLLERSPAFGEFYLTISWSILGFALFGVALAFGEKLYRYAGLVVLLLASGRVLIIDTVNLEPMPRVLAWFVLGLVMLALGFGYVKAFPPGRPQTQESERLP